MGDRVQHRGATCGVPQVSLHQPLAAVEREEARRAVPGHRRDRPQRVASGRLDTDHLGSDSPSRVRPAVPGPVARPRLSPFRPADGQSTRGQRMLASPAPPTRQSREPQTVCSHRSCRPRHGCAAAAPPPRLLLRRRPARRTAGTRLPRAARWAVGLLPSHSAARTAATPWTPPVRAHPVPSTAAATARRRVFRARRSPRPQSETVAVAPVAHTSARDRRRCQPRDTEDGEQCRSRHRHHDAPRRAATPPSEQAGQHTLSQDHPGCGSDIVHTKPSGPAATAPAGHGHQPARRLGPGGPAGTPARHPTIPARSAPCHHQRRRSQQGYPRRRGARAGSAPAPTAREPASMRCRGRAALGPRRLG